jgi:carboxymethylenebutenolidase
MNHIQRYLAEEVVEDYADGVIDRREALRQLGLLGVAAVSAVGLLAACDSSGTPATTPHLRHHPQPAPARPSALRHQGRSRSPGPRAAR